MNDTFGRLVLRVGSYFVTIKDFPKEFVQKRWQVLEQGLVGLEEIVDVLCKPTDAARFD